MVCRASGGPANGVGDETSAARDREAPGLAPGQGTSWAANGHAELHCTVALKSCCLPIVPGQCVPEQRSWRRARTGGGCASVAALLAVLWVRGADHVLGQTSAGPADGGGGVPSVAHRRERKRQRAGRPAGKGLIVVYCIASRVRSVALRISPGSVVGRALISSSLPSRSAQVGVRESRGGAAVRDGHADVREAAHPDRRNGAGHLRCRVPPIWPAVSRRCY